MLSALPPSDPLLNNPFWALDGGFTPWDCPSPSSGSGLGPNLLSSFKPNKSQTHAKPKPAGSDVDVKRVASIVDERKRRRMISNRESARRSRLRKQKHLENLRLQVNRLRILNRELNNRLQFLLHHCNRVRTENDWLRSEQTRLRQRLYYITQILVHQQPFSSAWPCNTTIFTTE